MAMVITPNVQKPNVSAVEYLTFLEDKNPSTAIFHKLYHVARGLAVFELRNYLDASIYKKKFLQQKH